MINIDGWLNWGNNCRQINSQNNRLTSHSCCVETGGLQKMQWSIFILISFTFLTHCFLTNANLIHMDRVEICLCKVN